MVTIQEVRQSEREKILAIARRHGASNVRFFGSVAREAATAESDLDLLVDLEPGRSVMDLGGLLMDLEQETGLRIDVATERMLRSRVRGQALLDAVPL